MHALITISFYLSGLIIGGLVIFAAIFAYQYIKLELEMEDLQKQLTNKTLQLSDEAIQKMIMDKKNEQYKLNPYLGDFGAIMAIVTISCAVIAMGFIALLKETGY